MAGGRLVLPSIDPVFTSAGLLNVGATLTVYLTGTTTLANIYADVGLVTPISNPQTSNSAGRFYSQSTQICALTSAAYDCVLALSDGETFTYEQVYTLGAAPSITGYAPINSPAFTGTPTAPTPATNDSSSKIATTQFVANAIANAGLFPAGAIWMFGMASLPSGWLVCDGSAVSRTTYATLFGQIGTTFGVGDGSTTFNLPNFLGYFPRGTNTTGSGPDPSRALGSVQLDQMQGHYHSPLSPDTTILGYPPSGGNLTIGSGSTWLQLDSVGPPITDGTNGTPRTGLETRPANLAIIIAIKF